jgi:cell division protein FtsB
MNRSRRKNWNVVNAPSLARWIVITGLLAVTGLTYVYLTIQLYHLGDQKKALEKSLADLRMQNEMAKVQIATLTSRSALQHRLKEGYLKMIAIAERNIVRLNPPRATGDDAVQPVVNERGGR